MTALDGLYRHSGSTTHWDEEGVTLSRRGRVTRLAWDDIVGVRQFEDRPDYVQLVVKGQVPGQRLFEDHLSIPVNSASDANRLLISLGWYARGRDRSADGDQRPPG